MITLLITTNYFYKKTEYHVHLRPVPADGNCTDTAGHLDSYLRGDSPPCNSAAPQTCEVGDLSGKYGTVMGPSVKKRFVDAPISRTSLEEVF